MARRKAKPLTRWEKGWKTRRANARKRSKAAQKGWQTRKARQKARESPPPLRGRKGEFIARRDPTLPGHVSRAYAFKERMRGRKIKGVEPRHMDDRIRVFYIPDAQGMSVRRFSLESFERFATMDEYRESPDPARPGDRNSWYRAIRGGAFWIGFTDRRGRFDRALPKEKLL